MATSFNNKPVVNTGLIFAVDSANSKSVVTTDTRAAALSLTPDFWLDKQSSDFNFSLNPSEAFTISYWIYMTVVNGVPFALKSNSSVYAFTDVAVTVQIDHFYLKTNSSNYLVTRFTNGTPTENAWNYMTYTYDGSATNAGCKVYKDGVELSSYATANVGTFTSLKSGEHFSIGLNTTTPNFNNHNIDNVSIYSKALTSDEVLALYNKGLGLSYGNINDRTINYLGAKFPDNSSNEYLKSASTDFKKTKEDFSVCGWFYMDANGAHGLFGIHGGIGTYSYSLIVEAGRWYAYMSTDGTNQVQLLRNNPTTILEWHFAVYTYDSGTGLFKVSIDNSTYDTATNAGGPNSGSTTPFRLGNVLNDRTLEGRMSNVSFYDKALTQAQVGALYTSESEYDNFTADQLTSLVSHWKLDEISGDRFDSHSGNTLTDHTSTTTSDDGNISKLITTLPTDLTSWWAMNETIGTRYDQIGNNHLTENGGDISFAAGQVQENDTFQHVNNLKGAKALNKAPDGVPYNGVVLSGGSWNFDGVNDYIDFGDYTESDFDGTTPMTISTWIKTSNIPATAGAIVTKQQSSGNFRGWSFSINNNSNGGRPLGRIQGGFLPNGGNYLSAIASTDVVDGLWHHVVFTYNGNGGETNDITGFNFYVDGVNDGIGYDGTFGSGGGDFPIGANIENLKIGIRGSGNIIPFDGSISNLKIYNRELTAAEVLQNYNNTKTRFI